MDRDAGLRRARELCLAGAFDEARTVLATLLSERSRDVDVLLLLGTIAGQSRDGEAAQRWFERARDVEPGCADAWRGLGLVWRQKGRLDEAVAAYERALQIDANDAETHVNLAVALRAQRRLDRAVSHLERAINLQPRLAVAYLNLGNCYLDERYLDRAGAAYFQSLKLDPRSSAAAIGLSKVFREQTRFELAERTLRAAAGHHPDDAEITATLGALLHDMGRDAESAEALDKALSLDPREFTALYYSGNLKRDVGRWDEAEAFYRRALSAKPDDADTLINLADCLFEVARRPEARRLLDLARQVASDDPDARYACGIVSLSHGELAAGWPDIASGIKTAKRKPARFAHLPKLDAPTFEGRSVVIWGDQGIGDEIIHGSLLLSLRSQAPNIVCEVDRRLLPLFSRGLPELTFVARTFEPSAPSPVHDGAWLAIWRSAVLDKRFDGVTHHVPLPDLGGWLRPNRASFFEHSGYLRADAGRVADLRRQLKRSDELLIGVSWRSHNREIGRHKSIGLQYLVEALPSARLRFVSLQYGPVEEEIAAVKAATGRSVEVVSDLDCFNDIDGLAALITACDAVVTVSNVTAHLAGGLGQKVALLCPLGPGRPWYWFDVGEDSPWYPSMRVFRQTPGASWGQALAACTPWVNHLSR